MKRTGLYEGRPRCRCCRHCIRPVANASKQLYTMPHKACAGTLWVRDSPREAVSTILTMFDIVLAALRGELLSKFGRRHEERTELIMSASRGILLSSFLVCAAGLSNTNEFNFPIMCVKCEDLRQK